MIIKTDIGTIPLNRATLPRTASEPSVARHDQGSSRAQVNNITDRLSVERSLGEALSIAQMSQNIIQKAISISQRLKNIAAGAFATGNVNTQALTETLTDIRSTMSAYGEQVPNPVQPGAAPSIKAIDMPDIRSALSSVRDIAGDMSTGGYNQTERIEVATRNLNDLLSNYRVTENKITGLMRETTTGFSPAARISSGDLVGQITTSIANNPGFALFVQGNINHTAAERLMS